ncbi:Clusterin-associated protein 1 [Geranomyces michiganensis]|nr:Clusterin-associated protein 1 [Geranomyces michiganensis]
MSYREMRSFTEKMRALGYPRLVSMEAFRMPNFALLTDILLWLVKSYDPTAEIPEDIDSEQDRIIFVKSVALFMAPKAHIKLNTRRLYMADGSCVRELSKVVNLLHEAIATKADPEEDEKVVPLDISSKLPQLKTCRLLATEITERGAKLYDALGHELSFRDVRSAIISRPFELRQMEASVNAAIAALAAQNEFTTAALTNLAADESNLVSKIEKKRVELDRAQKRLQSLQGVRPAYMDEYERIEKDLAVLYESYMERFRNLSYLEQQLDEYNRVEQDKFEETEESLKKMQSRLQEEEMRLLRGDKDLEGGFDELVGAKSGSGSLARPKGAGQRGRSYRALSGTGTGSDSDRPESESLSDRPTHSSLLASNLKPSLDFPDDDDIRDDGGSGSLTGGSDVDRDEEMMDDDEDEDDLSDDEDGELDEDDDDLMIDHGDVGGRGRGEDDMRFDDDEGADSGEDNDF